MIFTFGEGLIFVALMLIVMAIIKTGDRIVDAIRERGAP